MTISRQEWADWVRSPVTQAVVTHLQKRSDSLIGEMLNAKSETVEGLGIAHLAYRNQVNGIGEFLDLDSLSESIIEVQHED